MKWKAWSIKVQTKEFDFIKINNFCSLKVTVKWMIKQAKDWEKLSMNHIFDEELSIQHI